MAIPKTESMCSYPLKRLFSERFTHSDISCRKESCVDFESLCIEDVSRDLAPMTEKTPLKAIIKRGFKGAIESG